MGDWLTWGALSGIGVLLFKAAWEVKSNRDQNKEIARLEGQLKEERELREQLKNEQLRIVEALERTYAPKEFVFQYFITKERHTDGISRLEEKMVSELKHLNNNMENVYKLLEQVVKKEAR